MDSIPPQNNISNWADGCVSNIKHIDYKNCNITYGAITPLTSGDLGMPEAISHSSNSSANFFADERRKCKDVMLKIPIS